MKKSILYILFFCFVSNIYSQEKDFLLQAEELKQKIEITNGKERLKWLDSLATIVWRRSEFNFDSLAIRTINEAIHLDTADVAAYHIVNRMNLYSSRGDLQTSNSIFQEFKNSHIQNVYKPRRLSNFYKAGGRIHYRMEQYENANNYYDEALRSAKKTTDSQAIGEIYMGKGEVYYEQGKLAESSSNLQESIPYFKASGSINSMINVKNVMTSLYSKNGFYEEAQRERQEALSLAKEVKHDLFLSQIYFNKSVELRNRDSLKERVFYIKKALQHIENSRYKPYYKPIYLGGIIIAYSEINDILNAESYMQLLENENRKNAPGPALSFYKEAKMRLAYAKKQYNRARELGEDFYTYKKEIKQFDGLEQAELFLYKVNQQLGNHQTALKHLNAFQRIKDSITGLQKAIGLTYYQTLYETEKRDATIRTQQNDIVILNTQAKLKNQWILIGGLLVLLSFGTLIMLRSRAFNRKKMVMQQEFAQDLMIAQENERKTIAKELHDGIGQDLLLIKNSLALNLEKAPKLVDKTIEDIRTLSQNLHPVELEKFGLTKAIINLVETVSNLTNIFFTEEVDNIDDNFDKEEEINLYRIIQECINNIIKHSEATASKISIKSIENSILIKVEDNGKGFDYEQGRMKQKSLGIKSLIERVNYLKGKIEFENHPKKGATVKILLYKNG